MSMLILDREEAEQIKTRRKRLGIDGHDEIWEGLYIVMPIRNDVLQAILNDFTCLMTILLGKSSGHHVYPGINVSDRVEDWLQNVRCPDAAIYLEGNPAQNSHSHYCGGPDFLLEILTENDRSRDKLPFYASVNTREVLIVDRDPWALELCQFQNGQMVKVGESSLAQPDVLPGSVLPVSLRLVPGTNRPGIEATQIGTGQVWVI